MNLNGKKNPPKSLPRQGIDVAPPNGSNGCNIIRMGSGDSVSGRTLDDIGVVSE